MRPADEPPGMPAGTPRRTAPPARLDDDMPAAGAGGSPGLACGLDEDGVRRALLSALAAIAPESAIVPLVPQRPLREQVELDSLDWVNLLAALPPGTGDSTAAKGAPLPGSRASLDDIVAWACGTPRGAGVADAADAADAAAATDVRLRPLGAADAALEAAFVRELSDESRYMRFMGSMDELPPAKLAALTDVDQRSHVAIAAVVPGSADGRSPVPASGTGATGTERLVGVARYVVDDSGRCCEFAVTVADDWQRSGLAGRLMHALVGRARASGLARIEGMILAANRPMLRLARALGFELHTEPGDAHTVRATLAL